MELKPLRSTGLSLTLLLMIGGASPAIAGKLTLRPGMGGVPDLGAISCETFNDMYPAGPSGLRQAILYWTEGYVYARTGKTMDELLESLGGRGTRWNFETLTDHIVEFCRAKPEAPVPDAVADLWGLLEKFAGLPRSHDAAASPRAHDPQSARLGNESGQAQERGTATAGAPAEAPNITTHACA